MLFLWGPPYLVYTRDYKLWGKKNTKFLMFFLPSLRKQLLFQLHLKVELNSNMSCMQSCQNCIAETGTLSCAFQASHIASIIFFFFFKHEIMWRAGSRPPTSCLTPLVYITQDLQCLCTMVGHHRNREEFIKVIQRWLPVYHCF